MSDSSSSSRAGSADGRKRKISSLELLSDDAEIQELVSKYLANWRRQETVAEMMIPLIGHMYRTKNVIVSIYGQNLVFCDTIEIIKAHTLARKYLKSDLTVLDTYPVVAALSRLEDLPHSRICLGTTTLLLNRTIANVSADLSELTSDDMDLQQRLYSTYLQRLIRQNVHVFSSNNERRDVVLYGFGRIGRLLARILVSQTGNGDKLLLRAIVVRKQAGDDLKKRASLLLRDSVHGLFKGTVEVDSEHNALIINGNFIQVLYSDKPGKIDFTAHCINNAIVIDNTGIWRDSKSLGVHLESKGISKVVLTAPAKSGDIPTVVAGINDDRVTDSKHIYSAASCTTNATACVLKIISDKYGIESGHLESTHSFTNDQNLTDNYHPKERRGRSAPMNLVITETGAAKAIGMSVPEIEGLLTASAIRVPTPNVSLAILILKLKKQPTSVQEVNDLLQGYALHSNLMQQVGFVNSTEVVSTDFVGNTHTGIIDGASTVVASGCRLNLYAWYDNESGYSHQLIRLARTIAGLSHPLFPPQDGLIESVEAAK